MYSLPSLFKYTSSCTHPSEQKRKSKWHAQTDHKWQCKYLEFMFSDSKFGTLSIIMLLSLGLRVLLCA